MRFWLLSFVLALYFTSGLSAKVKTAEECAKYDFKDMLDNCCKTNPGNLFERAELTGCGYKSAANMRIMKSYVLNKADSGNYTFSVSAKKGKLQMDSGRFCFAECVFRNFSWINSDDTLNYDMIKTNLTTKLKGMTSWLTLFESVHSTCQTCAEATDNKTVTAKNYRTCLTFPAVYMQCINSKFITGCPSMKTGSVCSTKFANFKKCDYFSATCT
ncbi:uncharacterized protein LOC132204468 [Neocloeon triangulifer]|uniref:uncharacterized protein LOC132204468 n=1 Tax=Neocloeon triangulifer TaxID=2078957 RepID=UPI00286ED105|nr:uncharacterized protein LOC132204468 [Neocloeon triangulifer]